MAGKGATSANISMEITSANDIKITVATSANITIVTSSGSKLEQIYIANLTTGGTTSVNITIEITSANDICKHRHHGITAENISHWAANYKKSLDFNFDICKHHHHSPVLDPQLDWDKSLIKHPLNFYLPGEGHI